MAELTYPFARIDPGQYEFNRDEWTLSLVSNDDDGLDGVSMTIHHYQGAAYRYCVYTTGLRSYGTVNADRLARALKQVRKLDSTIERFAASLTGTTANLGNSPGAAVLAVLRAFKITDVRVFAVGGTSEDYTAGPALAALVDRLAMPPVPADLLTI